MRILTLCLVLIAAHPALAEESTPVPHLPPPPSPLGPGDGPRAAPPAAEIVNPAEFNPADGLILAWANWETQFICTIAEAAARDNAVYMLVRNAAYQSIAETALTAAGVNMANVVFIEDGHVDQTSMWIRDYGPFCEYGDGALDLVDFYYGYTAQNDHIPLTLAEAWGMRCFESPLLHQGGNHISDGNGMAFLSTNITEQNPAWTEAELRAEFRDYLGIDSLVVVSPMLGDLTRHIDMFVKLLNDTLFIVGEYADGDVAYPGDPQRLDALAAQLASMHNLEGRPFHVERIPMHPYEFTTPYNVNRTYTNAQIIGDKVLVPVYVAPTDAAALAVYEALMPDHEIIPIDSRGIIYYAGAVHCVANLRHADNPLMIFHDPLVDVMMNRPVPLRFTMNPRFDQRAASVFWRPVTGQDFAELPAAYGQGAFHALLPAMEEDFVYYIRGSSSSGRTDYETLLPAGAPTDLFPVQVWDPTAAPDAGPALASLAAYPNPFNPSTEIGFGLLRESFVTLTLHDVSGRRVRTLLREAPLPAGRHELAWEGRDDSGRALPSGVYLARLHDGRHSRSRRLILLK